MGEQAVIRWLGGCWLCWSEGGSRRAGQQVVQEWLAAVSATVVTLLSLEITIQFSPGAASQPHVLQQQAVCPGLLLGGVKRLVASSRAVPGSLLLPPLELLVKLVGVLRGDTFGPCLHLPLVGWLAG